MDEVIEHIPGCAQSEAHPCWNALALYGDSDHRWSGWPGAFCLVCHAEDPDEVCLALCCMCHCHNEMWDALEKLPPL